MNYSVVREREVVPTDHSGEVTGIKLGVTGTVPQSFLMEMTTFGPDRQAGWEELEFWHELYAELAALNEQKREAIAGEQLQKNMKLAGVAGAVAVAVLVLLGIGHWANSALQASKLAAAIERYRWDEVLEDGKAKRCGPKSHADLITSSR